MNARQMIDYFSALDWRLWQTPGRARGGWRLAPRFNEQQALKFDSLGSAWGWWREQLRRAMLLDQSFNRVIRLWRERGDAQSHITQWVIHGGRYELPDDLQLEIDLPYHLIKCDEQKSIRHACDYANDAWTVMSTDLLARITDWIRKEYRGILDDATIRATAQPAAIRRL